jgi:hypothetical protein
MNAMPHRTDGKLGFSHHKVIITHMGQRNNYSFFFAARMCGRLRRKRQRAGISCALSFQRRMAD